MSISFRVLGDPGRDNALLVLVDTGQAIFRLLFDCGENCMSVLPISEFQAIDHLFFSHFHMDHVGGFDSFFRCNFRRQTKPNQIWGPPGTGRIMQHRFCGFLWNLHHEMDASWHVHDILPSEIRTTRFELSEAFEQAHDTECVEYTNVVLDTPMLTVSAYTMDHSTPAMAYLVQEKARQNVDSAALVRLGLKPGPWLQQVKNLDSPLTEIEIDGVPHSVETLRSELLTEMQGDSICYLTDFLLEEETIGKLAPRLTGCKTMVCEAQYRQEDAELARANRHMTVTNSARLANEAAVKELILFHLSDRYRTPEWLEMLHDAKAIFQETRFPEQWKM